MGNKTFAEEVVGFLGWVLVFGALFGAVALVGIAAGKGGDLMTSFLNGLEVIFQAIVNLG